MWLSSKLATRLSERTIICTGLRAMCMLVAAALLCLLGSTWQRGAQDWTIATPSENELHDGESVFASEFLAHQAVMEMADVGHMSEVDDDASSGSGPSEPSATSEPAATSKAAAAAVKKEGKPAKKKKKPLDAIRYQRM